MRVGKLIAVLKRHEERVVRLSVGAWVELHEQTGRHASVPRPLLRCLVGNDASRTQL
jgi:hypothetical protein